MRYSAFPRQTGEVSDSASEAVSGEKRRGCRKNVTAEAGGLSRIIRIMYWISI